MANDPPTSLGMRFGPKRAHDSGMKGFSVPTAGQMNFHLWQERDLRELRAFLDANPKMRPLALRWADQQKEMGHCAPGSLLRDLRMNLKHREMRRKKK
jgi:hypothetical protein